MDSVDRLLTLLVRQDFEESHARLVMALCQAQQLDWEIVYRVSESHGVAPLIYSNLLTCPKKEIQFPASVGEKLKKAALNNIIVKEKTYSRLQEVIAHLNDRSIDVMMIKGAALDLLVYEYPWYTVSQDTDVILRREPGGFDQAERAYLQSLLHKTGIEFDYFEHHDVTLNGALPINFEEIWRDGKQVTFRNQSVYIMSPEDLLISLCINSCRKRFFRLKSLCDIAETIRSGPQVNWEELVRKATRYDCNNIVYCALLISDLTLGCKLPSDLLARLNVHPGRATLIQTLSRLLLRVSSFSSLSPFQGMEVLGRRINRTMFLPYTTYRGYQILRKLGEILARQANRPKSWKR